jgi:hypothetical protein
MGGVEAIEGGARERVSGGIWLGSYIVTTKRVTCSLDGIALDDLE